MKKLHYKLLPIVATILICTGAFVGQGGCSSSSTSTATYSDASDPVVVNSEKSLRISKDTFDLFLKLEYENKDDAAKITPKIHQFAEYLRENAPHWLTTANDMKNAYKHNRNAENKANLLTALATIDQATIEARTYINQIQKGS